MIHSASSRPIAKARTNTIGIEASMHAVATQLYTQILALHPLLHWHWQPAPIHKGKSKYEDRLEAERKSIYTSIFGEYDIDNARYLRWRKVQHCGADWLLCAVYIEPASTLGSTSSPRKPVIIAPPFATMRSGTLAAWVEMLCLWLVILNKPPQPDAWSDTCGPGAAWYVGLQGTNKWASAFRVDIHAVEEYVFLPSNTAPLVRTKISLQLVEQLFVSASKPPKLNLATASGSAVAGAVYPTTRIGTNAGPSILAWSRMHLGVRVPLRKRRVIFTPEIKKFWSMKWTYYNAVHDTLVASLQWISPAFTPEIFSATHRWCAPKISSGDLLALQTLDVVDLSFPHESLGRTSTGMWIHALSPVPIGPLTWKSSITAKHTSATPTLVVQPSRAIECDSYYCWYIDGTGNHQWVKQLSDLNTLPLGTVIDPYSVYKMSLGPGPLDTKSIQAITMGNINKHVCGKVIRELLMQAWWIDRAPIQLADCTLAPQTFRLVHIRINEKKQIGLVRITFDWNDPHLSVVSIDRVRVPNSLTFSSLYPSYKLHNGWWLEDAKGNRLECSSQAQDGFILRGDKHPSIASLRACIAAPKDITSPGKSLSRSAKDELLPYYTSPGEGVAQWLHKDTVYLQEDGQRLRVFVPPYVPLKELDGFRQFRVVRRWSAETKEYLLWDLTKDTPDLLYWYLRTLTRDLLQLGDNSQMSILEKMAIECQVVD